MSGRAVAAALGAAVAAIIVSPVSPAFVAPASARITEIRIGTIEPFADSQPFGEAGSYERVTGTAKGELDPQSAQNHDIADLDKAPRNARGLVEYETDFFMLRPLDPARGSGVIFYEVNNRGRKALLTRVDEAPADNNDPRTLLDAGHGSRSAAATPSCGRAGTRTRRVPTTDWRRASRSPLTTASRSSVASARNSRSAPAATPTGSSRN
jgi:hypothetical protein